MCESLHSTSLLPSPEQRQATLMYQLHLTATSLTLLGQGLGVLWTIDMYLRVWAAVTRYMKPFPIILPVIVTVQNKKWSLQLFYYHIYHKKGGFYSQSPPSPSSAFLGHLPPPLLPPHLPLFLLIPLIRNTQNNT